MNKDGKREGGREEGVEKEGRRERRKETSKQRIWQRDGGMEGTEKHRRGGNKETEKGKGEKEGRMKFKR